MPERSLDDPKSLTGATPKEVEELIPDGWVKRPMKKATGVRYADPVNRGDQVRLCPTGTPQVNELLHQGPYATVVRRGSVVRVPLAGNPVLKK